MSAAASQTQQLRLMLDMVVADRNVLRDQVDALRAQQPLAWCVLAENGNCIIWSRDLERVQWSAARCQRPVIALYTEARPQDPCTWSLDDDLDRTAWQSACGQSWMFTDGGPAENHVRYCHGCGRPVHIVQSDPEQRGAT